MLGPTGLSTTALKVGSSLHKMQTGYIYHYTLLILIGVTLLFGVRQLWLFSGYFVDYRLFVLVFVLLFFLVNNEADKEVN